MEAQKPLTHREDLFCAEYITCFNGAEAARRVGYAEKSAAKAAHRLLSDPRVKARIEALIKERRERLYLSADLVVIETLDTYQTCKAAKPVLEWDYSEHKMVETGLYQIDSKGATKCLELLAKFLGMDGKSIADKSEGPVFFKDDIPEAEGDDGE